MSEDGGYPKGNVSLPELGGGIDGDIITRLMQSDDAFMLKIKEIKANIVSNLESYSKSVAEYEKATKTTNTRRLKADTERQKVIDGLMKIETEELESKTTKGKTSTGAGVKSMGSKNDPQAKMTASLKRLVDIAEFKKPKNVWDQKGNDKLNTVIALLAKSNKAFDLETKSGRLEHNNDTETHRLLKLINGQMYKMATGSSGGEGGVFTDDITKVEIAGIAPGLLGGLLGGVLGAKRKTAGSKSSAKKGEDGKAGGVMSKVMDLAKDKLLASLPIPAFLMPMITTVAGPAAIAAAMVAGIAWMAFDGIRGAFKAESWGVGKGAAVFGAVIGGTGSGITNMFKGMGKWALIGAGIGATVGLAGAGLMAIPGAIIGGLIGAAIGGILGFIGGEKIAGTFQEIGDWFTSAWGSIIDAFKDGIWNGIQELLMQYAVGVTQFWTRTFEVFGDIFSWIGGKIKEGYEWILEKVGVDIDLWYSQVADVFGSIVNAFTETFQNIKDFVMKWLEKLNPLNLLPDSAQDAVKEAGSKVREGVSSGWKTVKDFYAPAANKVKDRFTETRQKNIDKSKDLADQRNAKTESIVPPPAVEQKDETAKDRSAEAFDDLLKATEGLEKANTRSNEQLIRVLETSKTQVEVIQAPTPVGIDMGEIRDATFDAAHANRMKGRMRWGL